MYTILVLIKRETEVSGSSTNKISTDASGVYCVMLFIKPLSVPPRATPLYLDAVFSKYILMLPTHPLAYWEKCIYHFTFMRFPYCLNYISNFYLTMHYAGIVICNNTVRFFLLEDEGKHMAVLKTILKIAQVQACMISTQIVTS